MVVILATQHDILVINCWNEPFGFAQKWKIPQNGPIWKSLNVKNDYPIINRWNAGMQYPTFQTQMEAAQSSWPQAVQIRLVVSLQQLDGLDFVKD